MFEPAWSTRTMEDDPGAPFFNDTTKYVVSATLTTATWKNSKIVGPYDPDAIQGDGFNPLWQEVQISFTAGHTPVQLTSDTQIADYATRGIIMLTSTTEIYRCSVVGSTT